MESPPNIFWAFDLRRDFAIPGTSEQALDFSVNNWIFLAKEAIEKRGIFNCALSGGSTPKKIFERLVAHKNDLDWSKVRLYFSDERCVSLSDKDSNYHMAWESGFKSLVLKNQIFPMFDPDFESSDPEDAAKNYEKIIHAIEFDLIMLGMGDDGHTASLFPFTHALHSEDRQVVANFLPDKEVWRITFTFEKINKGNHINLYVFGRSKAEKVKEVFTAAENFDLLPVQKIGTPNHKALWILDNESASLLSYSA